MSSAYGVRVKEEPGLAVCYVCGGPGAEYPLHSRANRGPYFPFLESHLPPAGAERATGPDGVVLACPLCYSFLTQQWEAHEQSGTPRHKRMYWLKRTDNGPFAGMESGSPPAAALDLSLPDPAACVCGSGPPLVQVYVRPIGNCPFFPSLGADAIDPQGRVHVCEPCHRVLLDQWDRFQRLAVPHSERHYHLSSRHAPQRASPHTAQHPSQHVPQHASQHVPQHPSQHAPQHAPQHTPQHTPQHVLQHVQQSPVQHVPQQVSQHMTSRPSTPPAASPGDSEAFTCFACGLEFQPSAQRTVATSGSNGPSFPFLRGVAPPPGARPLSPNAGHAVVCSMCYKSLLRQLHVFEIAGTAEPQRSYKILRETSSAPQAAPRKTSYLGCYLCEKIGPSDAMLPCDTRPGASPFFPFVEDLPRPIAARPMDPQGRVLLCAECHTELWRQWDALEWAGAGPPGHRRYALPPVTGGTACPTCGEVCPDAPLPLSSRPVGGDTPSEVTPFFPLLDTCVSGDGVALVCPFCFHSLVAQWAAYESSPVPEDALRARRRYNVHHYVCYICGITTYRKRVRPLTVRDFPFLREHPRPPGAVALPGAVVSCLTCWESLQSQWKDYERMRVPVEMRKYNWMVLPPPPENAEQEGFGVAGVSKGPLAPPVPRAATSQGNTRSSGFAAALRRLAKQALEPGQTADGAEETVKRNNSTPPSGFISGSPSVGAPMSPGGQTMDAQDIPQGPMMMSTQRDAIDFHSSRHQPSPRMRSSAEEPRGFQPYRTVESGSARVVRGPPMTTYDPFHPFMSHLAPQLHHTAYGMEESGGGFPFGLLRAPSLPPPPHLFRYPVPAEEHNGRLPKLVTPAVPNTGAPTTTAICTTATVTTTTGGCALLRSSGGSGNASSDSGSHLELAAEPSRPSSSPHCTTQPLPKFTRNGFFMPGSINECPSPVSQLDLWAACRDGGGSSAEEDDDEEEEPSKTKPIVWSGPPLALDVRPQKLQFLQNVGLTSHHRRQKLELARYMRHWSRLHSRDQHVPLPSPPKECSSPPLLPRKTNWLSPPVEHQEKFLQVLGLSPSSQGGAVPSGTKPCGVPNGLLGNEAAHVSAALMPLENGDKSAECHRLLHKRRGPSILLGNKMQMVTASSTVNSLSNSVSNDSSVTPLWPGVEALMEAYAHYHQERLLECRVLQEREVALAQRQQQLQEQAQELRNHMAELLQSKQKLDEERQQLEASLEQLRSCIPTATS
ncbi:uncharacterized protein LOC135377742 [Ornithodoros turicata]|uniref:uncharacterized protein LOC135377742 n=1 Tax=Ornithodoros turicata TaxID=34597 RepID=UPI0031397885